MGVAVAGKGVLVGGIVVGVGGSGVLVAGTVVSVGGITSAVAAGLAAASLEGEVAIWIS